MLKTTKRWWKKEKKISISGEMSWSVRAAVAKPTDGGSYARQTFMSHGLGLGAKTRAPAWSHSHEGGPPGSRGRRDKGPLWGLLCYKGTSLIVGAQPS